MGPLVDEASRERVLSYVELGAQEGARMVLDALGRRRRCFSRHRRRLRGLHDRRGLRGGQHRLLGQSQPAVTLRQLDLRKAGV